MTRYIDPLTDFGFKKLFGTEPNKDLLIAFLNQLLPQHHQIADLQYINNEHLGANPLDRKAIFDLYCQSSTGERFIVEVQQTHQAYFKDRSLYYSTFAIQEQAIKGHWNFELRTVYTIGILDFVFGDNSDKVVHTAKLREEDGNIFFDKLTYIYIELPRFTKDVHELHSDADKWLYLLKHLTTLREQPAEIQGDIYDRFFEEAELPQLGTQARYTYEDSLKAYRDYRNTITTSYDDGHKKGCAQGLEEGREEGSEKGKREMAQKMLAEGLSTPVIQSVTGLTPEEIARLDKA